MIKKAILKGSTFFIIFIFIISILNSILTIKTGHGSKLVEGLYKHEGDSYDVVLLGSSHMNGAVNPNGLWNEYGITSFNYATAGQPIDVTYYLLKEIMKKHDSKVVVLDLYYLGLTYEFGTEGYIRYVLDNMKFSENKVDAIVNSTPKNQWINYLLPIFKYHDRWKELKEKDFKYDTSSTYYAKGFGAGRTSYSKDSLSDTSITETAELPAKTKEYLYKIIKLSETEGFKLVFINAPHDYTSTSGMSNWHKEPAKMFNKIEEIAKENDIPFINYNNNFEEVGFDFKTDMYNEGHTNLWGANKITSHLGNLLIDNYDLIDHRNDKKYTQWNLEYMKYLQVESEVKNYVELMANKDYITVINCSDSSFLQDGSSLDQAFSQLGLKFQKRDNNNNYLAIIDNSRLESEMIGKAKLSGEFKFENDITLKVTTLSDNKNMPSVIFNGREYLNIYNGLNIVVYDKVSKNIVETMYLDDGNTIKIRK